MSVPALPSEELVGACGVWGARSRRKTTMTADMKQERKVHPALAFLASVVGLGLGYIYVGRLRAGIGTSLGYFVLIGVFSWTRFLVYSASAYWLLAALSVSLAGVMLIHPVVIAVKERTRPRRWFNRIWFYGLWVIASAVVGSLFISHRASTFGYETFRIPSASMEPSVLDGDYVMADMWTYRNRSAAPGDIAIVERAEAPGIRYIKRVVAVGGDTIEIREGSLYRNGIRIEEPYVHPSHVGRGYGRNLSLVKIDPGFMYVLGDYRDNSVDSRQWGPLPNSSLRGRVNYVWWSRSEAGIRWGRLGLSLIR
jgi:signal peptidase I